MHVTHTCACFINRFHVGSGEGLDLVLIEWGFGRGGAAGVVLMDVERDAIAVMVFSIAV